MPRVYFDTNVFSNLRVNRLPQYQMLNKLINERKKRISFYFSVAHIRDKRKDLSDFKFLDFEFMETLVGDNYVAYDPIKKKPSFYLATPKMAFDYDVPEEEYSSIIDFFEPSPDDDTVTASLKAIFKSTFDTLPAAIDTSIFQDLPEDQKKLISAFVPLHEGATFMDMMKNMMQFTEELHTDGPLYKELRTMIDQGLNNGSVTLNGELDFNEALKNTSLKKTFFDFVKDTIYHQDKDNIPYYDFYQLAYNMLDMLGISKDKISKKNTLGNLQNDGMHSYFAGYCDYFITDDKTITSKTKAMNNLMGSSTTVLSVEEFNELLPELISKERDDWNFLKNKLIWDYKNADRKEPETFGEATIRRLAQNHRYLDFFDAVIEVAAPDVYKMIAFKGISHSLSDPSYSECQKIIEGALLAIGNDDEEKLQLEYNFTKTKPENFLSRRWTLSESFIIELNFHPELDGKYGMAFIFPIKKRKPGGTTSRVRGIFNRFLLLFKFWKKRRDNSKSDIN